jgi:membrane dipeptidase
METITARKIAKSKKQFIFDAHLDLAMNAMEWNRNLSWSVEKIRKAEIGMLDKPDRGKGTVSLPALRNGNIRLFVTSLLAKYVRPEDDVPGWFSQNQAWAQTQGQLAWYKAMEQSGEMVQINNLASLESHLELWNKNAANPPIGYILSLEGADSVLTMKHLEQFYQQGLRAVGPAHYGLGVYAQGTNASGGLGNKGRELLQEMKNLNMVLDIAHLCDKSFFEAVDLYHGPIWASHANCYSLVPHNRQLTDEQIKILIERETVIGIALDAWMMVPNWERGISTPMEKNVSLDVMIDHMDHVCQIAGNANHVGIGSDLDGAFGKEQCPHDIDTIADLQKVPYLLGKRGYTQENIDNILSLNFTNFLRRIWA